jgi:hypothetical protein
MRASFDPLSSMMGCVIFASESASTVAGTAAEVAVAGVPAFVYGRAVEGHAACVALHAAVHGVRPHVVVPPQQ